MGANRVLRYLNIMLRMALRADDTPEPAGGKREKGPVEKPRAGHSCNRRRQAFKKATSVKPMAIRRRGAVQLAVLN
jgi:hypothetical protein